MSKMSATKLNVQLKTRNSEYECTLPPNIFAPIPEITPKPHFGGPFNAKPIADTLMSNVSATKLNVQQS